MEDLTSLTDQTWTEPGQTDSTIHTALLPATFIDRTTTNDVEALQNPAQKTIANRSTIRHWPEQLRPRERLLKEGVDVLSDAELLAIFLRTGTKGASAIDIARQLIQRFGSLGQLVTANPEEVMAVKGLGSAKYAHLLAALELGKRTLGSQLTRQNVMNAPDQVKKFVQHQFYQEKREVFAALFLDSQLQLLAFEKLFYGGTTSCQVHLAEIIRRAVYHQCVQIIICHNHPDATATPSPADIQLTAQLHQLCQLLDIQLIDHLISGNNGCLSMAEQGLMPS